MVIQFDNGSGWGSGPGDEPGLFPDDATPAADASAPEAVVSADASASTPSSASTPPADSTTALSPTGGAVAPTPAAAPPASFSVLDSLRGYGFDTSKYQSDKQALDHLLQAARQGQQAQQQAAQMTQWGNLYLQHQSKFQEYLNQQGQPAPAQGWKAPDFDPSWEHLVKRDEMGNIVAVPGAPPDVVPKFLAWQQHRNQFVNNFARDPQAALREHVEKLVEPMLQERLQKAINEFQQKNYAESTLNQAQSWMFQTDPQGTPLLDPLSGQKVLSQAGQLYHRNINELSNFNPQDMKALDMLARRLATGEIAYSIQRQTVAGQAPVAAPVPGIPVPGQQPNHSGSLTAPARATVRPPAQNPKQTLRQMLEQNFNLQGVTDADVNGNYHN